LPRTLAPYAVLLLIAQAPVARAAPEDGDPGGDQAAAAGEQQPPPAPPDDAQPRTAFPPDEEELPPSPPDGASPAAPGRDDYPPPVDGPALRLPEPRTRIYMDGAYAVSDDLTALPYVAGKGRNARLTLGGVWRWGRFAFDGQLPVHITAVDITQILNQMPMAQDEHQVAPSLGDLALGVSWTERLSGDSEALIGGFGLRGRLATHTTRFQFHLADDSLAIFSIPYYFHVEPTLILGGALGPLTYVINQGAVWLLGPDGNIQDTHIVVPSVYFWDAHYAIGVAPWSFLGASVELATMIQLNHLSGLDFRQLNDIRAVWVAPALQLHAGADRIDLIARIGLTRGQELYGVLEYVGTHSFTLRVTHAF
jgi:hypothetical protein